MDYLSRYNYIMFFLALPCYDYFQSFLFSFAMLRLLSLCNKLFLFMLLGEFHYYVICKFSLYVILNFLFFFVFSTFLVEEGLKLYICRLLNGQAYMKLLFVWLGIFNLS